MDMNTVLCLTNPVRVWKIPNRNYYTWWFPRFLYQKDVRQKRQIPGKRGKEFDQRVYIKSELEQFQ